jgi:large subunit ribosomal protein L25
MLLALREAGSTALIDLYVEDGAKPNVVLARDIQRDTITGRLQHLDFYQVRLTEKVKTSPRLEVIGESPLVESGGAVLVQILNQVEVECLPTDLVDSIPVDISGLEKLEDSISIGDLPAPPGVTFLADPGDAVVSVVPPRAVLVEEEVEEDLLEELVDEEAVDAEGDVEEEVSEEV